MVDRFASAVVRGRAAIVLGWIAAAAAMAVALPGLGEAQSGGLGDLVPAGSEAIEAEQRAAELFAFPLSSRTAVVERRAGGLPPERLALTAQRVIEVNRGTLPPLRDAAGAYVVSNTIPGLPFARERGTTTVTFLLFGLDIGQAGRTARAENLARALEPAGPSYLGVTGAIPARAAQAEAIGDRLPLLELATVGLVVLAVALVLRSLVAPLVTLAAVAISYLVSIRLIAVSGSAIGVSVPSEVEPVIVALLFGVVTDYALFSTSRLRRRLREGAPAAEAVRRTIAELTPVIFACGMAVAAGCVALAVAQLGFLRAFGPGMAVGILVGMAVTLTFLPACLALLGRRVFWPSHPDRGTPGARRVRSSERTARLVARTVRAPRRTIAATLAVLAAMASGLAWLDLGNPVIRGLPADSEARVAYEQLSAGFAPGAVAPVTLVVEAPGITERRGELRALQSLLGDQPGIAGVIGPADVPDERPGGRALGAVLAPTGDAVRYVLVTEDDPLGADAIRLVTNLRARLGGLVDAVGLPRARTSVGGDTALVEEIVDEATGDLARVGPAVLLAVGLVLAVFLRALVAPLYLVALAALAPLSALGLAVGLFQGVLGQDELTYFVPVVAGVLLVSLGSDYNIFLVGRIWDEARDRPLPEAIVSGATGAAHTISAAGLVLAASFGALALVPIDAFQQLAFVLAAGLLIDAFVVRTVLAPAIIALVGERSGWPGRRLRRGAPG